MRTWVVAVTIVAALAITGAATAAGPVRSEAVLDFPEPDVHTECDGFDVVLSNMHIERRSSRLLLRNFHQFSGRQDRRLLRSPGARVRLRLGPLDLDRATAPGEGA